MFFKARVESWRNITHLFFVRPMAMRLRTVYTRFYVSMDMNCSLSTREYGPLILLKTCPTTWMKGTYLRDQKMEISHSSDPYQDTFYGGINYDRLT